MDEKIGGYIHMYTYADAYPLLPAHSVSGVRVWGLGVGEGVHDGGEEEEEDDEEGDAARRCRHVL